MVSQYFSGSVHNDPRAFPPAPVDPAALAAALLPFGESRMLPPAAYTSAEVFEWERRHFFGGGWTCAAHGSQLPAPGAQLAVETGDGGALLVRGEDGGPRVREHLPAPRPRAAAVRLVGDRPNPSSARTTRGRTRSLASCAARRLPRAPRLRRVRVAAGVAAGGGVARAGVRRRVGRGGRAAAAGGARPDRRPVRAGAAGRRGDPRLRRRGELEDSDRELPRVLSLPDDPPGAVQRVAAAQRGELPGRRVLDRRLDVAAGRAATMSLDGHSGGVPLRGLSPRGCARSPTSGSSRTCC